MVLPKHEMLRTDDAVEVPGYTKPEHYPFTSSELTCQRHDDCKETILGRGDHPGVNDEEYCDHRNDINNQICDANGNTCGMNIPYIERPELDHATWRHVWKLAEPIQKKHACKQYLQGKKILTDAGILTPDRIPDVRKVSEFLESHTGWRLRPASGLCSAREFLACLAFRAFPCVLYMRHHSQPGFSPEPDLVHELLGHVPMFVNQSVADFSEEIGLASLDATDDEIEMLARLYWYSLEFGLIKEDGEIKVFGAGILSAPSEILIGVAETTGHPWFEPHKLAHTEYDDNYEQKWYAVLHNMHEAMYYLRDFCHQLSAHHDLHYDREHDRIYENKKHCRKEDGDKDGCHRCQEKHPNDRLMDTPRPYNYSKFGHHDSFDSTFRNRVQSYPDNEFFKRFFDDEPRGQRDFFTSFQRDFFNSKRPFY